MWVATSSRHGHRSSRARGFSRYLAVLLWLADPRGWLAGSVVAVLVAGSRALGGITSSFACRPRLTSHSAGGNFLCMTARSRGHLAAVRGATKTRREPWRRRDARLRGGDRGPLTLRTDSRRATMRHTGAGSHSRFPWCRPLVPAPWSAASPSISHTGWARSRHGRDSRGLARVLSRHRGRRELTRLRAAAVPSRSGYARAFTIRRSAIPGSNLHSSRRAGVDDVAGADAAKLAGQICERHGPPACPPQPRRKAIGRRWEDGHYDRSGTYRDRFGT